MMKRKIQSVLLVAFLVVSVGLNASLIYAQTPQDTIRFQAKNTGFGLTDVDQDGFKEIIMFDDNTGFVRVFEGTGTNTYAFVKEWQPDPTGWVSGGTVKSQIPQADFDKDGVLELYLSDSKGNSWIITPGGAVATMLDDANWTKLQDWKVGLTFDVDYNEGGENRGNLIGDVDRDGKPDIYLAGNNFGAILDIEYDGGPVTSVDSYTFYKTPISGTVVSGGTFARPANVQIVDMDNDGHEEILAIVPWSGANPVENLLGLYVFEYDITNAADIAELGDNTALTMAWHEPSDAVFGRGYVLTAGGTLRDQVDIDRDGKGEFLTYDQDGGIKTIYLFEASGDNNFEVIWQHQFSDGTAGIAGGDRGIMVTDIDHDGFQEIVVIIDSDKPGTTDGFDAGHIYEWDGRDINGALEIGLSQTPTATFDPPRDAVDRVVLENNSLATDLDNDGNIELVLTNRGGNGKLLSIVELTSDDLSAGVTITVELDEVFTLPGTPTDSIRFQAKNTGFGLTDIDQDGFKEIILFDDNTGFVRVYEGTGPNAYAFVKDWQPNPTGWVAGGTVKSQIPQADFDKNGVLELYLSDSKGNSWIITPGGAVATMLDDANWTKLQDWKVGLTFDVDYNEGGENRGNLIGDVDRDGKPDIYLAGNNFGAILDIEYDGGPVTSVDSYTFYKTPISGTVVSGGTFARPANVQIVDMDNDGHEEILAIVPWSGANPVENLLGLYVFEYDITNAADIAELGDNTALTMAWHEPSDAVFGRGYVLTAGGTLRDQVDIDRDGKGEFLTYDQDGGIKTIYLFEASGDNNFEVIWQHQFSDGTAGIAGGDRGIMVTDIDHDGFQEIVVIIDSDKPGTTDGFDAGHIYEWDGRDINGALEIGLSQTPTATFDPPRDAVDRVVLENNSLATDLDNDGNIELVLTNRGGNGKLLSIIQLTSTDLAANGVTMTVEFTDEFLTGVVDGPSGQTPREFSLGQNYPNPFNPSTSIRYDVPATANVSLLVYDILGRNVRTLLNKQHNAGSYSVEWDGKNADGALVTSGIYFYRLEAGQFAITKKMVLLR